MAATQKDPVLVVVQLTGGNDYLNTVIPYNNPLYRDNRQAVGIGDNQHHAPRQDLRHPVLPGADEEVLGRGQARHHARRRLPRFAALALPLDGHLAHLRAGQGRDRGLARPRGARVRPEEGERGHRRQLRPEPVPRPVRAGRAGGLRGRPARAATASCRASRTSSSAWRCSIASRGCTQPIGQRRDGVPGHHRPRLAEGCRHPEGGAGQVQVRREVPEHLDRPEAEGRRPGALRRPRHAHLLLRPRQLRHACRPEPAARKPVERPDPGHRGVHGRPAGSTTSRTM